MAEEILAGGKERARRQPWKGCRGRVTQPAARAAGPRVAKRHHAKRSGQTPRVTISAKRKYVTVFTGESTKLRSQTMRRSPVAFAGVALAGLLSLLPGQQEPAGNRPPPSELGEMRVYPAGEVKWQKAPDSLPPGAEIAILEGDPSKPGPFVFR